MADDMELVIKIPREVYIAICYNYLEGDIEDIKNIIRNGTPLPERHGDLKDMGNLKYMFDLTREDFIYSGKEIERTVKSMTTIIKSNKEEQTKKKARNDMTREEAIKLLNEFILFKKISNITEEEAVECFKLAIEALEQQPNKCEYCHEDSDGYIKPLEKNCHAYIRFGMHGWVIELNAKGWRDKAPIKFCPMCGRRLTDGRFN